MAVPVTLLPFKTSFFAFLILNPRFLSSAIKLAADAKDTAEIIKYAMQFEKDTLLYFHSLYAETKDPKAQKAIFKIIKEEMKHLKLLQDMAEKL